MFQTGAKPFPSALCLWYLVDTPRVDGRVERISSMSVGPAVCRRVYEEGEAPAGKRTTRKFVAIGDLHGDFHRLVRLLEEENVLIRGTNAWNPQACNVDLILIGDYVDWRGEPLEGAGEPVDASRKILELLFSLDRQTHELREFYEDFDGRLYAMRGNHDEMMLDALRIFDFMQPHDVDLITRNAHQYMLLRKTVLSLGLAPAQVETIMKFLNWYVQGGRNTLEGWGTIAAWKEAMDGELGVFLRDRLHLGVVVNNKMFAHTAPDLAEFWRPMEDLMRLPAEDQPRLRESFLWSRRLWGFDYYSGTRTSPFSQDELEQMLRGMGVEAIVVGHTPVTTLQEPFRAYEGKVINIDLHGIPGSQALVEVYDVDPSTVRGNSEKPAQDGR